jgi:DNA-binding transcriptional regulator YiaG
VQGRKNGVVCPGLIQQAIGVAGSQSALARALGMTRQTVSAWVLGKSRPAKHRSYRKLLRLTGRFGEI